MRTNVLQTAVLVYLLGCGTAAALAQEAKPPAPKPIDLKKSETYTSGKWEYRFEITNPGTRSEGRWGWLTFDGQRLPPAAVNDYYQTPWGPIYWIGGTSERWGDHGWLPVMSGGALKGKKLEDPAAFAAAVEATKADAGKLILLDVGKIVAVRLEGNPTTGYRWQQRAVEGDAVEPLGQVQYVPTRREDGLLGSGGEFVFKYRAVRPGKTSLTFGYVRPWEGAKPPAETFSLTVEVKPAAAPPPPR